MKRILCLLAALVMCAGLALPAYANDFVPSVSRPEKPGIGNVILIDRNEIEINSPIGGKDRKDYQNGEAVDPCIVVSTVQDAIDKVTDISQEERDLLVEIHQKLYSGGMKLPLKEEYVVVELLDISWEYMDCVQTPHTHEEELLLEENVLVADFDLGVEPDAKVTVMVYLDDKWEPVEAVTNNGDGTVTCEFQRIGPVAFCLPAETPVTEPAEEVGYPLLWVILLIVAFLLFLLLIFLRRKRKKDEEEAERNEK